MLVLTDFDAVVIKAQQLWRERLLKQSKQAGPGKREDPAKDR